MLGIWTKENRSLIQSGGVQGLTIHDGGAVFVKETLETGGMWLSGVDSGDFAKKTQIGAEFFLAFSLNIDRKKVSSWKNEKNL